MQTLEGAVGGITAAFSTAQEQMARNLARSVDMLGAMGALMENAIASNVSIEAVLEPRVQGQQAAQQQQQQQQQPPPPELELALTLRNNAPCPLGAARLELRFERAGTEGAAGTAGSADGGQDSADAPPPCCSCTALLLPPGADGDGHEAPSAAAGDDAAATAAASRPAKRARLGAGVEEAALAAEALFRDDDGGGGRGNATVAAAVGPFVLPARQSVTLRFAIRPAALGQYNCDAALSFASPGGGGGGGGGAGAGAGAGEGEEPRRLHRAASFGVHLLQQCDVAAVRGEPLPPAGAAAAAAEVVLPAAAWRRLLRVAPADGLLGGAQGAYRVTPPPRLRQQHAADDGGGDGERGGGESGGGESGGGFVQVTLLPCAGDAAALRGVCELAGGALRGAAALLTPATLANELRRLGDSC